MTNDIIPLYLETARKASDKLPPGIANKKELSMIRMIELRQYQEDLGQQDFNRDLRRAEAAIKSLEARIRKLEGGGGESFRPESR